MAAYPFIGSRVSLISKSDMRYEGTLYTIDPQNSTIALSSVKCFGTEDRREKLTPASDSTFQFITFKGDDIKSLIVCDEQPEEKEAPLSLPDDPAILGSTMPPPMQPAPVPLQAQTPPQPQAMHHPPLPLPQQQQQQRRRSGKIAVPEPEETVSEFDFQSANARFDKNSFRQSLTPAMEPASSAIDSAASASTEATTTEAAPTSAHTDSSVFEPDAPASGGPDAVFSPVYDKGKSFFDDLSVDRNEMNRIDQQTRRGRNEETFGSIASGYDGPRLNRRGHGQGRGGRRGGHGGRGGAGRSGQAGGFQQQQQQQHQPHQQRQQGYGQSSNFRGGRGRRRWNGESDGTGGGWHRSGRGANASPDSWRRSAAGGRTSQRDSAMAKEQS